MKSRIQGESRRSSRWLGPLMAIGLLSQVFGTAYAIPALQIGPGAVGDWSYDGGTETWVTSSDPFSLNAVANSDTAGANGAYAWDPAGSSAQIGYLILALAPAADVADGFDVTVSNDGGALSIYDSGFGTPPEEDPNSIPGHGIYDTYYEIYQFNFDGPLTTISDIQPGGSGSGDGYIEAFDIAINSLAPGATGIHFDLFTVTGDGILDLGSSSRDTVNRFAPFSHDGEYVKVVPVPAAIWLFGTALIGFIGFSRRTKV